jgi:cyclic lactone autoinducer peptide
MSKPKNNKLIPAKITGKIAALSCGAASIWGLKQPKEPRK